MLGLYDSGLGGLTVLEALRSAGVDQDVVYFADQAHVPYGDRTDENLFALLAENFALLDAQGVAGLVMACNTSCAVASRRGGFPHTRFPVLDLITNAAHQLHGRHFARIAVFATAATVRSGAYARAIRANLPGIDVIEIPAPALVPLVERGLTSSTEAAEAVRAVCRDVPDDVDAVMYGCTHYPMLDAHFAAALGPHVERIDPAVAQAAATVQMIREHGFAPGHGLTHYLTNGDVREFERSVRARNGGERATFAFAGALTA